MKLLKAAIQFYLRRRPIMLTLPSLSFSAMDFHSSLDAITLTPVDLDWVNQQCQSSVDPTRQWQGFLEYMAVRGVQQWLEAGVVDFAIGVESGIAVANHLRVNGYRLQIVPMGSFSDDWVTLTRSLPEAVNEQPHLYLLVEVIEETDQVIILNGLRGDQLAAVMAQYGIAPNSQTPITLPLTAFTTSPDQALLYLTCLDPIALSPQPLVPAAQPMIDAPSPSSGAETASETSLVAPLINVSQWLNNQLDAIAEQLAWTLLPPLTPSPLRGVRTPVEELEAIVYELDPQRMAIPPRARGAYQELQLGGLPLRLYAMVWAVVESAEPEWSLMVFLGAGEGDRLPDGLQLQIHDQAEILADQTFRANVGSDFLYAQVIGLWDESFTVTLALPNGVSLTLPPFTYQSGL